MICKHCGKPIEELNPRGYLYRYTHRDADQTRCDRAEPGYYVHSTEELITEFLDQVAEAFDADDAVSPETIFTDPVDGEAITALGLLQRIRLGKVDLREKQVRR
jgi:hypothetical protein